MLSGAEVSGGWKASGPSKARRVATAGAVTVPLVALAHRAWTRTR